MAQPPKFLASLLTQGCIPYGDCCSDYASLCTAPPPSPPAPPPATACTLGTVPVNGTCIAYAWQQAPNNSLPPLPIWLAEVSAAEINGTIFLFGDGPLGTLNNRYTLAYRPDMRQFEPLEARAKRPFWGDHSSTVVYKNELYAFGGLCCQQFCR